MSYLIAALVATVLLLILSIQNPGAAEVRFLFWHGSLPFVVLLLVTTALGAVLAVAAGTPRWLRLSKQLRETEAKLHALTVERTAPPVPPLPSEPESVPGLAEAAEGMKETPS